MINTVIRTAELSPRWGKSLCLLLILTYCGCGGGGGGGGDGRTRETAVRLIHGSLDGTPLTLKIAGVPVLSAGFLQTSQFVPVAPGPQSLVIEQANIDGAVVRTIPLTLEKETEYTLFVSGESRNSAENVQVLIEPVEQPERGEGRLRFLNSVIGVDSLTLQAPGFSSGAVGQGQGSGFITTTSGLRQFDVVDRSGRVLGSIQFELADRGEATVLAAGSRELGVFFTQHYDDLD